MMSGIAPRHEDVGDLGMGLEIGDQLLRFPGLELDLRHRVRAPVQGRARRGTPEGVGSRTGSDTAVLDH
jgi:hypothetical protein